MNCENCRWYEPPLTSLGHCRRNPPVIVTWPNGECFSDFPEVDSEDWCGQWQAVIDDVTPGTNLVDAWQKLCNIGLPGRKASDKGKGRK